MDLQNFKYTINRNIMPFVQVGLGLLGANRARRAQREEERLDYIFPKINFEGTDVERLKEFESFVRKNKLKPTAVLW